MGSRVSRADGGGRSRKGGGKGLGPKGKGKSKGKGPDKGGGKPASKGGKAGGLKLLGIVISGGNLSDLKGVFCLFSSILFFWVGRPGPLP